MGLLKKITSSKAGPPIIAVVGVFALVLIGFECKGLFGPSAAAAAANDRIFICSETGKSFHADLANFIGQAAPFPSPYSGKRTAYPAELCFWTKDGQPKADPTPVLMNGFIGKPEPTFCPDCGRLVVANNPMAVAGHTPPITHEEWAKRHGQ